MTAYAALLRAVLFLGNVLAAIFHPVQKVAAPRTPMRIAGPQGVWASARARIPSTLMWRGRSSPR